MPPTEVSSADGGEKPATTAKEARNDVFDVSPAAEAVMPPGSNKAKRSGAAQQSQPAAGISPAAQRLTPAFMKPLAYQSLAEDLVPDWDTLGPDAFPSRQAWLLRGLALPGQPAKDIRVVDVASDGAHVDRGEAAFEQANPLLQLPLPQGSAVCRVILGVPELGRLDREFAMRAVNLAGERIIGAGPDETFEKKHFRSRICPGFDMARLRGLWTMGEVAWQPFSLPIPSMRTPIDCPGVGQSPLEGCLRACGRDIMYFQMTCLIVQTIPLQNDRFLFICTLPSRKFCNNTILRSAADFADIKHLAGDGPMPSKEQIFEALSRDPEQTCREGFERLLLSSSNSATRLADGSSTERLCQLLLLDLFRAASEHWTRLTRDMKATMGSLDLPQLYPGGPEKTLMEMKGNCNVIDDLLSSFLALKAATEHLLQWLSFPDPVGGGGGGSSARHSGSVEVDGTDDRWLKKVTLALQADLEHTRVELDMVRDGWTRRLAEQNELVKKIESKNVARLTLLAAIFLPLSFGADLLGMQFRLGELGFILYDYLGLVVSAGLVLFLLYKVGPTVRMVARVLWADPPTKKRVGLSLTRGFLQGYWLPVLLIGWSILVASFMVGMTGDIPRSLVVLRYGAIAWGGLFGLYLLTAVLFGWLVGMLYKFLGWNLVGY